MNAPIKRSILPWPALVAGGCVVLLLLACGLSAALGTGGMLLTARLAKARSSGAMNATAQTAVVQDIRGQVEVQAADGIWSPAEAGMQVSAGQHVRTGSLSSAALVFNDGSRALLQASSEIAIDALDVPGGSKPRTILLNQISGQSDHDVTPNKHKDSRYEVNTPSGTGQAKGTQFQVIITADHAAYFYVSEGSVAVTGLKTTVLVGIGQMTIIFPQMTPLEPFSSVTVQGVVTQTGDTWIVNGQSFTVNEKTVLSGDPKVGDWVLVKGHLLEDETKAADWITRIYTPPTNEFRLTGTVESIGDTEWKVNGQSIAVTPDTQIDSEIVVNDTVLVRGRVLPEGKLQARSIQRIDEALGLPFDFTGVINAMGDTTWTISGISVTITDTTQLEISLKEGDLVRAQGYIDENNEWIAESIQRTEEDTRTFSFTGTLENKEPWKVSGISFETREWTEIDENLAVGDRVLVSGIIDENGGWIATRIERLDDLLSGRMILVGVVISTEPWVVSGTPILVNDETVIDGTINVGMLVRVEFVLQPDGTWLAVSIRPLSLVVWFPGCFDILATVVSVNGNQIQLANWPLLVLDDTVTITNEQGEDAGTIGTLAPGSMVRIRICFDADMNIHIITIIIIEMPDQPDGPGDETGKATVCHKPDKKGGHTLTISQSAVPAHLGHGDYLGACR